MLVRDYALDAVIVGSDQVWRLEYTKGITFDYFLDFLNGAAVKKISYAASFGVDQWTHPQETSVAVAALLQKMDAISVREDSGVAICKEVFQVDSVQMIDPTLLLQKEHYLQLLQSENAPAPKGGLAVYVLDANAAKTAIVHQIAQYKGLKPYALHVKEKFNMGKILRIRDCIYPKVGDWLSGFAHAQFVVTDSFHGVAFALLFQKPFIAICNADRGLARLQSLLKIFHLTDRLIFSVADLNDALLNKVIDFQAVQAIKNQKKQEASQFINHHLTFL
uniref:polysaccharide pyruvyl transferase family protein n=1 Tax=Pedobacter sp. TaxID=1411316 RepID=UPI003D7FD25C